MNKKTEFLEKLNGLLQLAQGQGSRITVEEVRAYFAEDALTEEQMMLVFDYLLAQKVTVKGYVMAGAEEETETVAFSDDEEAYLREYAHELRFVAAVTDEERETLYEKASAGDTDARARLVEAYLYKVIDIAKEMYRPDMFLGDLIQEGNLGLIIGAELIAGADAKDAHAMIEKQIRQSMQMLLDEQTELANRDKKMVEKVQALDDAITALTEELGRKVSIDELAVYMGMEIEEIEDILKLAGEDTQENEEEE